MLQSNGWAVAGKGVVGCGWKIAARTTIEHAFRLAHGVCAGLKSFSVKAMFFVMLALVLTGCSSFGPVNGSVDGVSKPSDLEPRPWPEAQPSRTSIPDGGN